MNYRLATTDDMMADVLQMGHRAIAQRYDPASESVISREEWVMPADQGPLRYGCGCADLPADIDDEFMAGMFRRPAEDWLPDYQDIWGWIADVLSSRCSRCRQQAAAESEGQAEALLRCLLGPQD